MSQEHLQQEIRNLDAELMDLILEHWNRYGHFGTWQFWTSVGFFIVPLLVTLFLIHKKKIFQIAFYGYSFHVIFVYLDVFFTRFNFWSHPYHMIPFIPVSIPVDGSFVPVIFLLTYQYAIKHKKNFYLLTLFTAAIVTATAWFWQKLELLELHNGMNLFHIYLLDTGMAVLAYWFTNLFLKLKK